MAWYAPQVPTPLRKLEVGVPQARSVLFPSNKVSIGRGGQGPGLAPAPMRPWPSDSRGAEGLSFVSRCEV